MPSFFSSRWNPCQHRLERKTSLMHNRGHVSTFHWPFWSVGSSVAATMWPSVWPISRPIESCHVALNPRFINYVLPFVLDVRIIRLQLHYKVVRLLKTLLYRNTCFCLVNNYLFIIPIKPMIKQYLWGTSKNYAETYAWIVQYSRSIRIFTIYEIYFYNFMFTTTIIGYINYIFKRDLICITI